MRITTMTELPFQWDDLVDSNLGTVVTIYTWKHIQEEKALLVKADLPMDLPQTPGIQLAEDGVYGIVVDEPEITKEVLKKALTNLSRITGTEYELE